MAKTLFRCVGLDVLMPASRERLGYPQKTEALLERIIKASSNESDG